MTGPETSLDHAAAVRAAAGFTDVADTVDARARALRAAVESTRWGADGVGAALTARHALRAAELTDALPSVAAALRGLHTGVVGAADALAGTDADGAGIVADLGRGER